MLPMVLVVEDEPLLMIDVEHILENAGFLSVTADGTTGRNEIENDCSRFSALLTDIDLGSKVSGWDLARRARELCPGLPVVYMSGGSSQDWQAYGVPQSVMLAKPFAPAQLVTALATLINAAVPRIQMPE